MATERNQALLALAQWIREARKSRGFSQEGFAAQVGLSRAYYGAVERGERNLSALNLIRIAVALNLEVGELFPPTTQFVNLVKQGGDQDRD